MSSVKLLLIILLLQMCQLMEIILTTLHGHLKRLKIEQLSMESKVSPTGLHKVAINELRKFLS